MKRICVLVLGGILGLGVALGADLTDRDGDGLPDVWEIQFGMRTNSSSGIDGADGDPDGDGLSNMAEYLAGNTNVTASVWYCKEVINNNSSYWRSYTNSVLVTNLIENGTITATNVANIVYTNLITVAYTSGISSYAISKSATTLTLTNYFVYTDVASGIFTDTAVFDSLLSLTHTTNKYSATSGLSPTNAHSFGAYYSDYFIKCVDHAVYLGWMFSDNDFVDSAWENVVSNGVSPRVYDANLRDTQMALDAWSRCRMSSSGTTNSVVDFDLHYYGIDDPNRTVTIYAYSTATMDGVPDAIYVLTGMNKRHVKCSPTIGALRSGIIYFVAAGGTTWTPSEPFGIATPLGTEFGWDHISVNIELTDYTPGYLRMTMADGMRSEDVYFGTAQPGGGTSGSIETHVRVVRMSVDDNTSYQELVLDKRVALRGYLHEGDLLADGQLALDWGLIGVPDTLSRNRVVYSVILGNSPTLTNNVVSVFTNTFDSTRAIASSSYPIDGAYVYAARPTFKWTMPANYTAFTLEIRQTSETGPVIYNSGAMQVPVRNIGGECVWKAPIYANARLANGQIFDSNKVYFWRVIAMNAKFSNTSGNWSAWKKFRLDVNPTTVPAGYGAINARVKYFGPAASLIGLVKVQAFQNASFTGLPEAEYTLAGTNLTSLKAGEIAVNAVIHVEVTSPVYLRAFIDNNQNGVRDDWESWGYANNVGMPASPRLPYDAKPVYASRGASIAVVDIMIQDADSDQDWFPDAWEFEQNPTGDFLGLTGPVSGTSEHPEINPTLASEVP